MGSYAKWKKKLFSLSQQENLDVVSTKDLLPIKDAFFFLKNTLYLKRALAM